MKYKCGYKYITGGIESIKVPEITSVSSIEIQGFVKFENGELSVANGYAWNGASFILFSWFGTPSAWMTPSLFHDALYQLGREGKIKLVWRKVFDGIFYRLLRERGVSWPIAKFAYYCVRIGGNYCLRHGAKLQEAP